MIIRVLGMWKAILLISCFIHLFPSASHAQSNEDMQRQAFLNFEKDIHTLVASSMERFDKSDLPLNEEYIYMYFLTARDEYVQSALNLQRIAVPTTLPNHIKRSLEKVKSELIIGLHSLEESMDVVTLYMITDNPLLYDLYKKKRENGFLYLDGGLTSLATVKLRLEGEKHSVP
ncbi:hypothetical protein [Bacillus sp. FJAT-50079]|uniref:hypothetical protein n=1 Tax=Bacillus sp. FJAT-50079 TaxID=2833577 RepID=UPI001BC90F95|nr:hypothetical protein [Bacillus sp. FJAT-50079]MBS4208600.1 hypothetical protein [Bacillus sp. FJAT-50079]